MKLRCKLGLHKYHRFYWTGSEKGTVKHHCAYCPAYTAESYEGVYVNPVWAAIMSFVVTIIIIGGSIVLYKKGIIT